MAVKVSIIIVTLNRPEHLGRCLNCLFSQDRPPDEIAVVDSSQNDDSCHVAGQFRGIIYLRNENGFGRMTASRNLGLVNVSGDIIAFLDDDAFAHTGWCEEIVETFLLSDRIGAVGGRVLPVPKGIGNRTYSIGEISKDGVLHGNFWANPSDRIDVDHIMGCNMAFRRDVLAKLGGFREDYPGISGIAEDSDMCLRVGRLGFRIVFTPWAVVDHIGAPQAKGKRFDTRYAFSAGRNYTILLAQNFGLGHPKIWRYLFLQGGRELVKGMCHPTRALHTIAYLLGTVVGLFLGIKMVLVNGRSPVRSDRAALAISAHLSQSTERLQET